MSLTWHGRTPLTRLGPAGRRTSRLVVVELAFIALFVVVDWASTIPSFMALGTTPWSPATGLAVAWLIRRGIFGGISLFVALLISAVVVRLPPETPMEVLESAVVNAGGYALATFVLVHVTGFDRGLERLRDVITLLVMAGVSAAGVSALDVGTFIWSGKIAPDEFLSAATRQWVGDVIGIAIVTPTVLRALQWQDWSMVARIDVAAELVLWAAAIGTMLWIVFGVETMDEYKFFYLLFLPVVAVAVRHGIDGACMATVATQVGIILWSHGRGFGATAVTDFQFLLLALTVTGLLTGAVVSERERAERATRESERRLRESQDELEVASRLSALGEMASTMAHELNQPMTASRAYIRTAQRLLSVDAGLGTDALAVSHGRAVDAIGNAVTQIDLAANIVRTLRELVRGRGLVPEPVHIEEIIDQSLALLRSQVRLAGIHIMVHRHAGLPAVMAERIRVQQVLLNLLRNAIDAVRTVPASRRRIEVEARIGTDNNHVEVAVRDNGPGVRPEIAERLFTAFVTDKAEGLGLGLSICRGIIQAHGGKLWLESSSPQGADFRFTLPTTHATMRS